MLDKNLLEREMKKKKINIKKMCELLGMSRSAFYRKTTMKSEFTRSEIDLLIDILEIKNPVSIFFNRKVS